MVLPGWLGFLVFSIFVDLRNFFPQPREPFYALIHHRPIMIRNSSPSLRSFSLNAPSLIAVRLGTNTRETTLDHQVLSYLAESYKAVIVFWGFLTLIRPRTSGQRHASALGRGTPGGSEGRGVHRRVDRRGVPVRVPPRKSSGSETRTPAL